MIASFDTIKTWMEGLADRDPLDGTIGDIASKVLAALREIMIKTLATRSRISITIKEIIVVDDV